MPRATSLTDEVQRKVVEGISAGLHVVRAAELAGIGETTFYVWMEKGDPSRQADQPQLPNMARRDLVALAKAHGVAHNSKTPKDTLVERLETAGVGSWARYAKFREAVEAAEAELEQRLVAQWQLTMQAITRTERGPDGRDRQVVVKHANFQSAATFLARRFPQRWSPTHVLEISGRDGGPIVTREERVDRLADWLEGILDGTPPEEIAAAVIDVESKVMGE